MPMIVDGHLPSFPDFHGTETEQELDLSYWPGLLRLCQICEDARSGSWTGHWEVTVKIYCWAGRAGRF